MCSHLMFQQPAERNGIFPILQIKRMRLRDQVTFPMLYKQGVEDLGLFSWVRFFFFSHILPFDDWISCFLRTLNLHFGLISICKWCIASQNNSGNGLQTAFFRGICRISDIVSVIEYSDFINIGNKGKRQIDLKTLWF